MASSICQQTPSGLGHLLRYHFGLQIISHNCILKKQKVTVSLSNVSQRFTPAPSSILQTRGQSQGSACNHVSLVISCCGPELRIWFYSHAMILRSQRKATLPEYQQLFKILSAPILFYQVDAMFPVFFPMMGGHNLQLIFHSALIQISKVFFSLSKTLYWLSAKLCMSS